MRLRQFGLGLIAVVLALPVVADSPDLTRDSRRVTIDGTVETWELRFTSAPKSECADEGESPTAPCMGFSHGEEGEAEVVRVRDGKVVQRLALLPLYRWGLGGKPVAATVRFPARTKPAVVLEDLDGDGKALEFVLQTDSLDSSMQPAIALAWNARTNTLDAIRTVEHPERPLVLFRPALWRTLQAHGGLALNCGNHGGEVEVSIDLSHDAAGWHAALVQTTCDAKRSRTRQVL